MRALWALVPHVHALPGIRPETNVARFRVHMHDYMTLVGVGLSALVSVITSLVVWGNRGQVSTVHQNIETMRQEFRANMAEAELRIIKGINGTYARTPLFNELVARVDRIESRVDDIE